MRSFALVLPLFVVPVAFAACGGTTVTPPAAATGDDAGASGDPGTGIDAGQALDHGAPSDTYPAPHAAPPQVVTGGGPVLTAPRVVPIFYPGFDHKAEVLDYLSQMGGTDYWSANVSEYGVGKLTAGDPIELTGETPPGTISDDEIKTFLQGKLDGTHPEFGSPDSETIYTLFYPSTTTITLSSGGQTDNSCDTFGGYHDSVDIGGKATAYAVIPECQDFGGLTGVNVLSSTSSHEWIEASTDPFPMSDPAYTQVDDNHLAWAFLLGGSETGDMCAQDPTSFYEPNGFPYYVQRSWSNAAAKAGKDPCVPAPPGDEPYFNSAPVLNDKLTLSGGGQSVRTIGAKIPVGTSKTIEIDLFSEAKTSGPWTVSAHEYGGRQSSTLDLQLDKNSGVNGEKIYLTITATAKSQYGASIFSLSSKLGGRTTHWYGFVGN